MTYIQQLQLPIDVPLRATYKKGRCHSAAIWASPLYETYKDSPELLKFYQKKLLEPGWSGQLNDVEIRYIKSRLKKSKRLKRRWEFYNGNSDGTAVTRKIVETVNGVNLQLQLLRDDK